MYVDLKTILAEVPYSRASLYRLIDEGLFPRQVKFGKNKVMWRRRDIDAWFAKYDPPQEVDPELEDLLS